jgi:hypothetical protein
VPVTFELSAEETELARTLAEATYQRHRSSSGSYRNLPRSHLVGKLGEMGVEKWLRSESFSPDAAYRDPERERDPDLVVDARGIAVKSWRPDTWPDWGRCITPSQMPGMQKKAQAIVWTIVEDELEPVRIEVAGWSTPDEVAATELRPTGPPYKPIVNHQVDIGNLRELRELVELLRA